MPRELVDHDATVVCRVCYETNRVWHDGEHDEAVVGYTERDPMRDFADKCGGRCVDCGALTYFNPSAFGILSGTSVRQDGAPAAHSRVFT